MAVSSFYYSNPTPDQSVALLTQLEDATTAANSAAAAANALSALFTVVEKDWTSPLEINWSAGNLQRVTLGGDTTLSFTGGVDGEKLILELTQDGTGSRNAYLPANVRFGSAVPSVTLSSASDRMDRLGFIYNATEDKYDLVAASYGFY